MIQLKTYQEEAVNALLKDTFALLNLPGAQQKMVFKCVYFIWQLLTRLNSML